MRRRCVLLSALALSGCGGDDALTRLSALGAFDPPAIDFGEVAIGLGTTASVALMNTGAGPLSVTEVPELADFVVKGLEPGLLLAGGARVVLEASFVPLEPGERAATLDVITDGGKVPLTLRAVGVEQTLPVLDLTPNTLDFGVVEIGQQARLPFALDNLGNASATITAVSFSQGGAAYQLVLPGPIIVAEGVRGLLTVTFAPPSAGAFPDTLVLTVAELAEPIQIPLSGFGGDPAGRIFCQPGAVIFDEVARGETAEQQLACTARGGSVRVLGSQLDNPSGQFSLGLEPPQVELPPDGSIQLPVIFAPTGLPGDQRANLSIDYEGPEGPERVEVPITGTAGPPPPEGQLISATLRWDTANTDLDLHLVRPGGTLFVEGEDCFYKTKDPDWGVAGDPTDNPFLDIDDVNGFGPETINMAQAADGTYRLEVHYFKDRELGPSVATLTVFVGGAQVAEVVSPSLENRDVWHVGDVRVLNGTAAFEEVNSVSGCACTRPRAPGERWLALLLLGPLLRRRFFAGARARR